MSDTSRKTFSWDFIEEIGWWTLGIAGVAALIALVAFDDVAFATSCALGAVVDVALVRLASGRARRGLERGEIDNTATIIMVAGRLVVKAVLLLLALAVPDTFGFAGMVVGVLAFDITLAIVGSVKAASRTMRRPREEA